MSRPRNFHSQYGSTVTGRMYHERPVIEEVDAGTMLFGDFRQVDERIMAHQSADEFRRAHHVEQKYYRHRKRGGLYEIVGLDAKMQMSVDLFNENQIAVTSDSLRSRLEAVTYVAYRSVGGDGPLYFRPRDEFFDGRFEEVWQ